MIERHLETLCAAVAFAAVFAIGGRLRPPDWIARHRRRAISFAAGVSLAYVFIHLLPELSAASEVFVRETERSELPFPTLRVYSAAMLGFMLFYGLSHLLNWSRREYGGETDADRERFVFRVCILTFSAYVWLVSYLMIRSIEEGPAPIALYALAMCFHFLTLDHSLRHEYGARYDRGGRHALALAALAGWAVGALTELPKTWVITFLGLIAGGIIMNTVVSELPREKEGRFWPFLAGGILYALALAPLR